MKSSLKNMVLTLLLITLVSAALLGAVYSVTKGPIEEARAAKTTDALSKVMPEFDNDPSQDTVMLMINGLPVTVYTGKKSGTVVGYAVESSTNNGFSGEIRMMTGFEADGTIRNIEVLLQNETPGLGSKMADPGNVLLVSFQGKNPADLKMTVKKDGGDIDALTASTISSRAYAEAVESAYMAYLTVAQGAVFEFEERDFIAEVISGYDNNPLTESTEVTLGRNTSTVFRCAEGDRTIGYAVRSTSDRAFKDEIVLMTGFDTEGTITGISVVEHHETPGYGAVVAEEDNPLAEQLIGRNPGDFRIVFRDRGGELDAISGSTITSEAYLDAVNIAWDAFVHISN